MIAADSTYPSKQVFPRQESTLAAPRGRWQGAANSPVAYRRDSLGQIRELRIGAWRVLAATETRRIADVRELSAGRTAVLIERRGVPSGPVTSLLWQLYDGAGRLLSAMQSSPDGQRTLMMNYQTRQACQVNVNDAGTLETVGEWFF